MNKVIAISREFGSGGRTIGKMVAEKLGIPCYDNDLITETAKKSGLAEEFIKERGEYMDSPGFFGAFGGRDYNGHSIQDDLWRIQRQVIEDIAQRESCVIVGRCADYILRDKADILTVFIHSAIDKRAERIVRVYGEREEAPEQRLKDKDKRRKAFYQLYTDLKWGDIRNYHIALDSGVLGIDRCADLICEIYGGNQYVKS